MKLSVIIVTYDMQREAPRTIESVSPALQRRVRKDEYELIVIDNGSPEPLTLPAAGSDSPPVKIIRHEPSVANKSPVFCVNDVVRQHAQGEALLICIDGARMFSSHVIRRTIDILSRHHGAATFVGSRHLGPKVQMKSTQEGYNQAAEDKLLASIDWQADVDSLYDISVWAGAHKGGASYLQNESNAIGVSRRLWDAIGGYNEGFARPGGGLCNLELFNRLMKRADGLNILLYGEATFHQVHGGAATSSTDYFAESLVEYREATGEDYQWPEMNFMADFGAPYDRMQRVGKFLHG